MTDNPFQRPQAAVGDKWDLKAEGERIARGEQPLMVGHLFLIYPKEHTPNWEAPNKSSYKPTDLVVADVIQVTGPLAGTAWLGTFILSKGLTYILKDKIGDPVPGVLGRQTTQNGTGWTLIDAQNDQEWDAMCAQVAPVHQRYLAGQFKRPEGAASQTPAAAGTIPGAQQGWQQDAWGGLNAAPPQAGWNAPAAPSPAPQATPAPTAAPPAAAPAGQQDPNVGLLIGKGLDPAQVLAMDPSTRAAVLATY